MAFVVDNRCDVYMMLQETLRRLHNGLALVQLESDVRHHVDGPLSGEG